MNKVDDERAGILCDYTKERYDLHTRDWWMAVVRDLLYDRENDRRVAWGVVHNAKNCSRINIPRWAAVMNSTGLGSSSATALCAEHGADPGEMIPPLDKDWQWDDGDG